MNDKSALAGNPAPSNTVDFRDVCSLGMDQAIGVEQKKVSWFAPFGKFFKSAAQAIGFCVEMHRSWLSLLAPHASSRVSTVANNSSSQSQPTPDELAYSMDTALGLRLVGVPGNAAAIRAVRVAQPQPTPDELAYSMDIALGERFTAFSSSVVSGLGTQSPTAEAQKPGSGLAKTATAGS